MRRTGVVLSLAAAIAAGAVVSCTENLPSGPNTFAAHLSILAAHDTVVVGDLNPLTAQAKDDQGRVIQGLSFVWSTNNPAFGDVRPSTAADSAGHAINVLGVHTGQSVIGLSLPDPRFVSTAVSRTQTVVVAGVKVLSTHDSTLTAVNDTGAAIAMGLVHSGGNSVTSPGQTIRWTHLGTHVTTFGGTSGTASDSIRYIARSNGVDTLIATDAFCLAGAKCADTVVVRVSQQLTLTLSSHAFNAFSFNDSVGPTVVLADRRGNGLAGTSIRLVPISAADSAVVAVSAPIGTSNPVTGQLATPQLIAIGNGPARVAVLGVGIDGISVVASDTITVTVRQVARRVDVEPLIAIVTANDSIPIKPEALDARGSLIADATITLNQVNVNVNLINGIYWAGPTLLNSSPQSAVITPTLSGVALPSNVPAAPQVAPIVYPSQITLLLRENVIAGATVRPITVTALDSLARPPVGKFVRFGAPAGLAPDSVQLDISGTAFTQWTPRDTAMVQTLTGLRGQPGGGPITLADSVGRIVLRRSVLVLPDVPSPIFSTVSVSPSTNVAQGAQLTFTVKIYDRFGDPITTETGADFTITPNAGGGTFGAPVCNLGVCTLIYTAPNAAGTDVIHVQMGGVDIVFSPITITIT